MNPARIPNIGPGERRKRAMLGALSLAAAVVVVVASIVAGAPGLRWFSLPLVWGGFLGLLQDREKT